MKKQVLVLDELVVRAVADKTAKIEKEKRKDLARYRRMRVIRDERQKELVRLMAKAEAVIKSILTKSDQMRLAFLRAFSDRSRATVMCSLNFNYFLGIVIAMGHTEPVREEAIVMYSSLEQESFNCVSSDRERLNWFRKMIPNSRLAVCCRRISQPYGVYWAEVVDVSKDTITTLTRLTKPVSAIKTIIDCIID